MKHSQEQIESWHRGGGFAIDIDGNDGVVVAEDGTKCVSSVRYDGVSRIRPGKDPEIIATGIPRAASLYYDSVQNQLVISMNPNSDLAFLSLN